jgi:DNA-binding NarL/FixJ family response regulator
MENCVSIFVIASNRLLREALTRILSKKPEFAVIGAEPICPCTCDKIISSEANLLLLNWTSAGTLDLNLICELHQRAPELKILLVGVDDDEHIFLQTVQAGIRGYVLKDASAADILTAIRNVAQGDAACPPRLCRWLFQYVASLASEGPSLRMRLRLGLTRREQELVPLIAQGLTNKEIAAHFGLSEQTIKNHIHRMLQKTGANDRLMIVEIWRTQNMGLDTSFSISALSEQMKIKPPIVRLRAGSQGKDALSGRT